MKYSGIFLPSVKKKTPFLAALPHAMGSATVGGGGEGTRVRKASTAEATNKEVTAAAAATTEEAPAAAPATMPDPRGRRRGGLWWSVRSPKAPPVGTRSKTHSTSGPSGGACSPFEEEAEDEEERRRVARGGGDDGGRREEGPMLP